MRMPEEFRALEPELRSILTNRLKRGKVDCNLRVEPHVANDGFVVNESTARALLGAAEQVREIAGDGAEIDLLDVLRWPGVIDREDNNEETLEQLISTRAREGEKLGMHVLDRCDSVAAQISLLRERIPEIIVSTNDRHAQRIADFSPDTDKARIEQECALLVQKLDISEEVDRLEAHLEEVRRVIGHGSPAGRRLDFLMQELNREANTVGSKSAHIDSSAASVELKVLIEQMREQIQNIE
jgi:uncharacterized protein (TIGR00255 family)